MVKPYQTKPFGLPAKIAAPLFGMSLPSVYRRIREGNLPLLRIGGHKLVSIAKLEETIGRAITLDEINAAVAIAADAEVKAGAR